MIHAIRCDQPSFKNVEFAPGFNVVLATRTMAASDKDSRNGAGKTTLVEIVHFCLGSSADKRGRLMAAQVRGWTFTVELDLRGKAIESAETRPIRGKFFWRVILAAGPLGRKRIRRRENSPSQIHSGLKCSDG